MTKKHLLEIHSHIYTQDLQSAGLLLNGPATAGAWSDCSRGLRTYSKSPSLVAETQGFEATPEASQGAH